MPQQPRRLPGERNPRPDPTQTNRIQDSQVPFDHHGTDYGIARGLQALWDWNKRRRQRRSRER